MDETPIGTKTAAEMLGLSEVRVRQFIESGRLPATNIGSELKPRYVLKASEVEAFAKLPRTDGYPKGKPRQKEG
jgi:excisionase family DNA binding protein